MKKHVLISVITFISILIILPLNIFAQCLTAPYGQKPVTTQTISNCNGVFQTIASNSFNGEYSKVNVNAGNIYSFKSSKSTDYITISNNDGNLAYANGTGTVNWTASFTGVIRFYTHKNSVCTPDNHKKKRLASCTIPPCPSPGIALASLITDSTATITWNPASPAPNNGYEFEIRSSGSGGSGPGGLASSGSTIASITSANISGLIPGTFYTTYVRSNCGLSYSSYVTGSSFTTTGTAPNPVPHFDHIVVVIGENTNASAVFGNSSAPYINALASAGAKFTNSFALFHPSQPNYIALYSGSNQGITNDNYNTTKFTTANLGRELIDAGRTFATYSEDLPNVGYDGNSSGLYERKHNPSANWMGTGTNQIPITTNQAYSAFPVNYSLLPNVSFVVPNQCNDGHNICAPLNNYVRQYDLWIETQLNAYKLWAVNNNSLLIVTYDEDDFTPTNKIATVFYGAYVAQGTYAQNITHYNVLRTIEEANRLTTHAGAAATNSRIDYCWTAFPSLQNDDPSLSQKLENVTGEKVYVYPNPAKDKINLVTGKPGESKNINWEITDITGAKHKTGITNLNENGISEIAINEFENGIYFIHISDGNNLWLKRFVIAR